MDSASFFRYLTFRRWSRLFAFIFGFIALAIIVAFFTQEQSKHEKKHWSFTTIPMWKQPEMDLEPYKYYKFWHDDPEYTVKAIFINGRYIKTPPGYPNPSFVYTTKKEMSLGWVLDFKQHSFKFPVATWYVDQIDSSEVTNGVFNLDRFK